MARANPPKRVLLVEDNPGDVRLVELAIQRSNFQIEICHRSNGEEALEYLREWRDTSPEDSIDTMVLDLNLPRKGGFEVLRSVKEDPRLKNIPVLIFTSSEAESDVRRAFELNADGYILKGPTLQDFRNGLLQSLSYWLSSDRKINRLDIEAPSIAGASLPLGKTA